MTRRLARVAMALAGAFVLVTGADAAGAPVHHIVHHAAHGNAPSAAGPFVPSNGRESVPLAGGSVTSSNWSGYVVTPSGGDITGVDSSFTVPTAGLVLPGFSATWTGIGGYSGTDLIQAGVAEDSFPNNPLLGDQYFAWYELLPGGSVQLTNCTGDGSCAVNPGDNISVHIFQTADDVWTIDVADAGHWTWSLSGVAYASSHSSAEWILEAPQVDGLPTLIAGDGTAHFGPVSSYTVGAGSPQTIAAGDPTQIDLGTPEVSTVNLATPSPLASDGQSFDVCVYAESCAAP